MPDKKTQTLGYATPSPVEVYGKRVTEAVIKPFSYAVALGFATTVVVLMILTNNIPDIALAAGCGILFYGAIIGAIAAAGLLVGFLCLHVSLTLRFMQLPSQLRCTTVGATVGAAIVLIPMGLERFLGFKPWPFPFLIVAVASIAGAAWLLRPPAQD